MSIARRTSPRWAIIGTGAISHHIAQDLQALDGCIETVYSRTMSNAVEFADGYGIPRATDDYGTVLADPHVDAVYIATPFTTHVAFALQAIRAGKHVLVEKPMAMSADEVEHLFDEAAAANVFLMEAMWTKFTSGFAALQQQLQGGRIGAPRSLRASFGFPIPQSTSKWRLDGSPGALLDQGIYAVMLAHALFGEPLVVHAAGTLRSDGLDIAEHFTLEHANGCFTQGAASLAEFLDPTATIAGMTGWITVTGMFWTMNGLEVHADDQQTMFGNPEEIRLPHDGNGYRPMLAAVQAALHSGLLQEPTHTRDDTLAVFRTLDAIRDDLREATPE